MLKNTKSEPLIPSSVRILERILARVKKSGTSNFRMVGKVLAFIGMLNCRQFRSVALEPKKTLLAADSPRRNAWWKGLIPESGLVCKSHASCT